MKKESKNPNCSEWNLGLIISERDIEENRRIIEERHDKFAKKWQKNRDYLINPEALKEALDDYEELQRFYTSGSGEHYYFLLKSYLEMDNPSIKSRFNQSLDFVNKLNDKIRFFTLSLSKITKENQKIFLQSSMLNKYKHFLEKLFLKGEYMLSENEEKILALKEKVAYDNWEKLTQELLNTSEDEIIDSTGKKLIKNFNEIRDMLLTKDNDIRKKASEVFDKIVRSKLEIAEIELNSLLENKKIDDELRKMPRPDFSRHLSDDISSETIDILVKSVSSRFDVSNRYYNLKLKLLRLPRFYYSDRNIEYLDSNKNYSYEESVKIVRSCFENLDSEFLDIFDQFIKEGQIDVFPKKGKRGGAFCFHYLISHPTYILLNHNNTLSNVLTLAHELGHGINNEFMKKKQNSLNFDTIKSTAEVASTFMEDFVLQSLLKKADDEFKLGLMMAKLQDDIQTIFRQVACYMFEQEIHAKFREKGYLSKEEIGKIFSKYMLNYLGDTFQEDDSMTLGWVHWPHIRDFFYNYSYASGLLISKFMQARVKEDKSFIDNVKEFLSTGTSDSPRNIFLKMGMDISKEEFWLNGIKEIEFLLDETEKLAKKLGKI
ncbi:M3 family oligoendopeptidase [Candidatus Pacearchaeota archaeon]|nr:M3 family oligoendopeptidase [Candidatus Pacearchaeota archaeon]